ncbi:hypothetical protein EVAR_37943_1 [Eumeta japonica]|uniref:Uncharacterized protein n=1 Tax=Eumeta variegata TaxID=151549 RepID=A0A4C1XBY4_EUMVA|nr:hypothetical protein EVAR_37943_1 [Eumeta japonica]
MRVHTACVDSTTLETAANSRITAAQALMSLFQRINIGTELVGHLTAVEQFLDSESPDAGPRGLGASPGSYQSGHVVLITIES